MRTHNWAQRVLCMLLVSILLVSLVPANVFAASSGRESDTIFFATDRHEESSKLKSLLQALAYTPGLVVLGGDHVNNTNSGSLASITAEIQNVYSGVQTFYTYAAHDENVSADSSNPYAYARTGEYYEGEDYYVYAIDQDHMESSSNAATAAASFQTWAAGVDSSKVIFVVCHMPIHSRRGDNAGGATWMNALNEVGQSHDIVYLWGHNHTGENSTDTSVYFVGVGGSLTPQGGSTGTINFTYMNAGYIKNGYCSMVVVDDDAVNVTRYSTSGSSTANYTIERRFAQTHTWEVTESVAATCDSDGYEMLVCAECGESKTQVIAATGHDYSSEVQNTCTGSFTVYTCDVCGHSYSEANPTETTYDAASSLTEGESYVIVASNYALTYGSSAGKTSVSVSNGSITSDVTDAMIWTYENGMLSNSSSGSTKYINLSGSSSRRTITFSSSGASVSYSSNKLKLGSYYLYYSSSSGFSGRSSGSTVTLYQVNEAVGGTGEHTYESVTVEPTCVENGSVTYTCTSCGYSYSEVLAANGSHSYTSEKTEPTCTADGSIVYTCQCGDTYTESIPAKGHTYESLVTAPTCTEAGYTTYTCACGDSYIADEVAALGHSYTAQKTEATCTAGGSIVYTCQCGDTYTESIPAKGHTYESLVTAPTCTEAGYTTYTCACGDSYVADEVAALGHSYTAQKTEATCTADGAVVYTCQCGDTYSESIPAKGHTYESLVTAPTCTEAGYTTYTCACGDSYQADYTAALGHSYTAQKTEATCTEVGGTTYTCHCGDSYVADEIPALGHDLESVVTEATCETAGYTTHTCSRCGEVTVDGHVAALGHDLKTVTVEATCTESGSVTETCARCGETNTEVIPAKGHKYETVMTAPTCTEGGYTTYTCVCGDTYVADETAALGHAYESVTTEATCTKDGSVVYTCRCGETYTEIIPAKGHTYESVVTAPTCTEAGYTTYTCACGDSYVADEVAALGHTYEAVVTAPTCTEAGYTTYACACGASYVADEVAALGHTYESVVTAPTCTEDGYTTYTCACGDTYTADKIAALGHSYSYVDADGCRVYTCGGCGHSYSEQLAFTYSQVSSFASGERFVITIKSSNKYYALSHSGNSISAVQVTVSDGEITSEITEDLLWTYSDNKLSYVSDGTTYYLYTYTSGWWFWSSTELGISSDEAGSISFSGTKLKIDSKYLRYSSSKLSVSSSAGSAYIFQES